MADLIIRLWALAAASLEDRLFFSVHLLLIKKFKSRSQLEGVFVNQHNFLSSSSMRPRSHLKKVCVGSYVQTAAEKFQNAALNIWSTVD